MAQQQEGSHQNFLSSFATNLLSNYNTTFSSLNAADQTHQERDDKKSMDLLSPPPITNSWFSPSSSSLGTSFFLPQQSFSQQPPQQSMFSNRLTNLPHQSSSCNLFKSHNHQKQQQYPIDSSSCSQQSTKKRKRCEEEENDDEENDNVLLSYNQTTPSGEVDLMKEALILPTNVDMEGVDDSSLYFPQSNSMIGGSGLMQFSLQHQQPYNLFPLFESEEDMITSASASTTKKKNRMSPQSHLIEFIRDNIMQYLLFHLKLDMRQTMTLGNNEENNTVLVDQVDDVEMTDDYDCVNEQDVDITIPVGLLLDYIVQQAQRLYFNMYEYIRELASSSIKHQCKSNNQKDIELSLACNEFEKVVIEQVHFLLSQIQLMRSNNQSDDTQIIPMLKKYDKILPKNFHTLRLVSSTSDDRIGSHADSFTLEGIVDESFLFKSTSPYIHRSSFAHNFDDMKTNSHLNDISSLLLNTKFNFNLH